MHEKFDLMQQMQYFSVKYECDKFLSNFTFNSASFVNSTKTKISLKLKSKYVLKLFYCHLIDLLFRGL